MTDTTGVYGGPWQDFVARRDALAKAVRASGDRTGADAIKALRKPSRTAWALNAAADSESYRSLIEGVAATYAAHSKGGDVRGAMTRLRDAIRAFASDAADISAQQGHVLDQSVVVNAVYAVLGDNAALELLARGQLADVPEGGGLDILASMTAAPMLTVSSARHEPASATPQERRTDAGLLAKRRKALARAEAELSDLRATMDEALRALNKAHAEVDRAQRRADEAMTALVDAQAHRDATARAADAAKSRISDAEEEIAQLRSEAGSE